MDEQQRQLIQQMQQQMQQQFQLQMQQMQQQMQQQFQLQVQQMVSLVVPQQEPLPAPPQTQAPPPPVMPARGAAHPARLLGPAPDFPPLDAAPGPTFPAHNAPDSKSPPGAPTCQGRVSTEVGLGTEAGTKVQRIAQLWLRRNSRGARALWRMRGTPPTGQLGHNMF